MNEHDALAALKQWVRSHRTQGDAALALGISRTYLIDILAQRRNLPDAVLERIGLERIVTVRRRKSGAAA